MFDPQVRFCERFGGVIPRAYSALKPAGVAESSTIVLNRAEAMRGCRGPCPPLAIDFENEQIENKPPVLHRGKLTFNLAKIDRPPGKPPVSYRG